MKTIKTGFNKLKYNNALEVNPKTLFDKPVNEPVAESKPFHVIPLRSGYADNEFFREWWETDTTLIDEISDEAYDAFESKCEKELMKYLYLFSDFGHRIIDDGKYDAGSHNASYAKEKTIYEISPKDGIVDFLHACMEKFATNTLGRYMLVYGPKGDRREKRYDIFLKYTDEVEKRIKLTGFTPISLLGLGRENYIENKEDIIKGTYNPLTKHDSIFQSNAKMLFRFQDLVTTEKIMQWNKGHLETSSAPGLYPLIARSWFECVNRLLLRILCEPNDMNDKNKPVTYYKNKIRQYNGEDLLKATIPKKLSEATPKIARLTEYMSDLFTDALNTVYSNILMLLLTQGNKWDIEDDKKYQASLKNFHEDVKNDITNELEGKLKTEKEDKERVKKELDKLKKEYEKLKKESSPLSDKNKKLEKQHKEDLKKIRALTSEKDKTAKILNEEIEILRELNKDTVISTPIDNDFIPELPNDYNIAFCLDDKYEKTAKALEEYFDCTVIYRPEQITNQDIVVYLTEMLSHSLYRNYKKAARKQNIPEWHTMLKNPEAIEKALANYLYRKENNDGI